MAPSRIQQLYSNYLGDQTVLENPEQILGPNCKSILDFWESLDESVLRTEFDGSFEIYSCPWGKYLRPCRDPLANSAITKENYDKFEVAENVNKIPSDIWTAWILLCFHFVDKVPTKMEVLVRFLRNEENPSQFMAVVPKQSVTGASAKAGNFNDCCNLLTGEKYTSYPPEGWIPCGSSHSHNTLFAGWSDEDDTHEIPDPGIHITVGEINSTQRTYQIAASVTGNLKRFKINYTHLIDTTFVESTKFHENVLEYVEIRATNYQSWPTNVRYKTQQRKLPPAKTTFSNIEEYREFMYGEFTDFDAFEKISRDPFHYSDSFKYVTNTLEVHQIADSIEDFIKENRNDADQLEGLQNALSSCLIDLQLELNS